MASPSLKHFVDVIYDVPPGSVNINNLKAIIRDKAWEELPEVLKMKERPEFDYVSQYFLIPQVNGNICVLKHFYIKQDKVKGSYVARLIRGQGFELSWGGQNKQKARRGFRYMRGRSISAFLLQCGKEEGSRKQGTR